MCFWDTDRQVATSVMETMETNLSQFENFLTYLLELNKVYFLPKIISKCCELVKLCHINRSGPVFLDLLYFSRIFELYLKMYYLIRSNVLNGNILNICCFAEKITCGT